MVNALGDSNASLEKGALYICGTPIGNLGDASFRLIEVLNQVDLILCEDTRRTKRLLSSYKISRPLVAFHEHVEKFRSKTVLEQLSEGKSIALVSDAGMPVVSDPGSYLVKQVREEGFPIIVIPGPSAVTTALALTGFRSARFLFAGFPPRKRGRRQEFFREWIRPHVPTVFFESPYRLVRFLTDLRVVFPTIKVSLCHEMTKLHESIIVGPIDEVLKKVAAMQIKGEWVVVAYLEPIGN